MPPEHPNESACNEPSRSANPLDTPVQFVRGVGPQRAELLAKLGIQTAADLLFYLPRDVLDLSDVRDPEKLQEDLLQSVVGKVVDRDSRYTQRGGTLTGVLLQCGRSFVRGLWFNQPWMGQKFLPGSTVLFSGKPKRKAGRWEFNNPHVQWLDVDDETSTEIQTVIPRYGLTEGLRLKELRRCIQHAVEDYVAGIPEHIPESALKQWRLLRLPDALRALHLPKSVADYEAGRRRVLFDDLVEFQLAVALRRRAWRKGGHALRLTTTAKIDARIRRLFPFQFTAGQNSAVRELVQDLDATEPMHRLLQADVGAGKTAIAIYGLLVAVANEAQAVLMAPTELLASQHWQVIDRALHESRVKRALLTSNLTAAQRRDALAGIASGEIQLIVGTQAVIQKDVRFSKLGLAIIDEQHKFGVGQRSKFSDGDQHPHVLVMTATPIPRSLCMAQFGDLDVSVVSDLPPGRQPVKTYRVHNAELRARAWKFIRERLTEGRQVFVVCPRVGDAEAEPLPFEDYIATGGALPPDALLGATEEVFRQLQQHELKDFRIGIVHGQMDRDQRAATMEEFRRGDLQALVATTVIEVGVDVPNATVIVIQEAERFGLSQLHQLRGRVGRGRYQGYCFLFSDNASPEVTQRLGALEKYSDGFQIAEVDFELRGPGDVLGTRQHGAMPLKVADLVRDQKLVEETRLEAFSLVDRGDFDSPEFVPLKLRVLDRFAQVMDLPRSG